MCFTLQTSDSYSHYCNLIEHIPELSGHYSTVFGINCRSPLESLPHFSVAEGSMIPNIMHDVLEGVLPIEIKSMLQVVYKCIILYYLASIS